MARRHDATAWRIPDSWASHDVTPWHGTCSVHGMGVAHHGMGHGAWIMIDSCDDHLAGLQACGPFVPVPDQDQSSRRTACGLPPKRGGNAVTVGLPLAALSLAPPPARGCGAGRAARDVREHLAVARIAQVVLPLLQADLPALSLPELPRGPGGDRLRSWTNRLCLGAGAGLTRTHARRSGRAVCECVTACGLDLKRPRDHHIHAHHVTSRPLPHTA